VTLADVIGFTLSTASDMQGQHRLALELIPGEKKKSETGARERARTTQYRRLLICVVVIILST
jgi:hypothetical protein